MSTPPELPTLRHGLDPLPCHAVLGVPPWARREEVDRRFAERYRAARRDPGATASQEDLNAARAWFDEPAKDVERRFWSFPLGMSALEADLGAEAAPPPEAPTVARAAREAAWL